MEKSINNIDNKNEKVNLFSLMIIPPESYNSNIGNDNTNEKLIEQTNILSSPLNSKKYSNSFDASETILSSHHALKCNNLNNINSSLTNNSAANNNQSTGAINSIIRSPSSFETSISVATNNIPNVLRNRSTSPLQLNISDKEKLFPPNCINVHKLIHSKSKDLNPNLISLDDDMNSIIISNPLRPIETITEPDFHSIATFTKLGFDSLSTYELLSQFENSFHATSNKITFKFSPLIDLYGSETIRASPKLRVFIILFSLLFLLIFLFVGEPKEIWSLVLFWIVVLIVSYVMLHTMDYFLFCKLTKTYSFIYLSVMLFILFGMSTYEFCYSLDNPYNTLSFNHTSFLFQSISRFGMYCYLGLFIITFDCMPYLGSQAKLVYLILFFIGSIIILVDTKINYSSYYPVNICLGSNFCVYTIDIWRPLIFNFFAFFGNFIYTIIRFGDCFVTLHSRIMLNINTNIENNKKNIGK